MGYTSIEQCILDLEKHGQLLRITEEVDPNLEMAAIHLRVNANNGPAILFENVKGTKFRAVSNLFGTKERIEFIFRDSLEDLQFLMQLKSNPSQLLKQPFRGISKLSNAYYGLPKKKNSNKLLSNTCQISDLPLIKCWPKDGGAFVTLPLVYSEDIEQPGIFKSNMGMYRIQLSGNQYKLNQEVGLHYQLHRGIGVHQTKTNKEGKPLKVSVFVGGPPAHTLAAVMPLPEGIAEALFAGVLGKRRFRYSKKNDFVIPNDSDFVITGEVFPNELKPEGPFGDHLGYYSLQHPFPVMKVKQVYHKKNAIWSFTVVGRPPQEDSQFGSFIHDLTGDVLKSEIPGLKSLNAVDEAGVHPLLLTIGSERYTPYTKTTAPQELLTIANRMLGTGQLSLAKFLFIANHQDNEQLDTQDISGYFTHILERVNWQRDLHFYTKTSIDTLDYSGTGLNNGSKVVIAAVGKPIRKLATEIPPELVLPDNFENPNIVLPGILAISYKKKFETGDLQQEINLFNKVWNNKLSELIPLIIIADDSDFVAKNSANFVWVTFTRANPANDILGINEFINNKHWGCKDSLIIDARRKPHHAPPLISDEFIEKKVDNMGKKGAVLNGII